MQFVWPVFVINISNNHRVRFYPFYASFSDNSKWTSECIAYGFGTSGDVLIRRINHLEQPYCSVNQLVMLRDTLLVSPYNHGRAHARVH